MTVAVAEFKGPEVHGVVRFAQASNGQEECTVEAVIDGLAPGAHGWSVHEFGDLTQGALSTGPAYIFPPALANPSSVVVPVVRLPTTANPHLQPPQNLSELMHLSLSTGYELIHLLARLSRMMQSGMHLYPAV